MKYRVHFEASAAIGIEVEVEADDAEAAEQLAQAAFDKEAALNEQTLSDQFYILIDGLMKPHTAAIEGFNEGLGDKRVFPITHATVEVDEMGFEIVEAFNPEDN